MIYLLDRHEQLLDIISETDLTEFVCQVSLYLEAFKEAHYFGFFHREVFKIFRIVENQVSDSRYVKGIDRAESDLRTVTIIKDKRPHNVTADQALTVALEGTGYRVGVVEGLPKVASTSFYYISPLEALVKIIDKWQCEFRVRYTFVENAVTGRYIDLYKSQGKVSGKQFYYGDNLLSVVHEESADHVVTALIGRGKGEELDSGGYGRRIEFTDVVWSKSSGKPTDKPAGQNYVVNDKARQLYGLSQDGTLHHRWGVFIDENIEDAEELLTATYAELERLSAPLTVFKASILSLGEDVWLGDSVAIIRDELKIAFEARVQKLVIDLLNFEQSEVILGDYQTLQHQQQRSEGQRLQQTLDERLSPYAQELQRFYERVETEKERRNAEIDEQFRLARLDFDNYKELAETKANDLKEEITSRINADLRPLADEAKRLADGAVADLARQRQELEAVRSSVGSAKADAIREATSQLNTARQELAGLVDGAKREARELVDGLSVGGVNLFKGTRDFSGNWYNSSSWSTEDETYQGLAVKSRRGNWLGLSQVYDVKAGKQYVFSCYAKSDRENDRVNFYLTHETASPQAGGVPISQVIVLGTEWQRISILITISRSGKIVPRLERPSEGKLYVAGYQLLNGNLDKDWSPAPEDFNHTIEQLDNGYREKFKEIESKDTERRTFQTEMEKTVDGFRTSISSLNQKFDSEGNLTELSRYKNDRQETDRLISQSLSELATYKDGENDRSRAYFEASRAETARQLREERQAITENYVAKNQYDEDALGITRRFESLSVGGVNLIRGSRDFTGSNWYRYNDQIWQLDGEHQGAGVLVWQSGPKASPIAMYQVEAGKSYTFSAWFKKDTAGTVFFYLYDNHSTDMRADVNREHRLTTSGGQFERYQLTFKVTRSGLMKARFAISPSEEGGLSVAGFQLEEGNLPSPYRPNEEDFRSEFATYKQGVDGQLSELTRQVSTTDGSFNEFKNTYEQTSSGINQKLTALETYKNAESQRSSAYFEASKRETARQLEVERRAITESYVAKNTYQRDAQGFSDRFERVETGLNGKVSSTTFKQTADEIKQSVSTLDGQVMKSSDFTIDENGLVLRSGREFNGSTITSLLTVNPDNIKAITDKMIITPAQRNLVSLAYRERLEFNKRNSAISGIYSADDDDFEFLVSCDVTKVSGRSNLKLYVKLESNDDQVAWRAIPLLGMDTPANQKVAVKGTLLAISPLRKVSRYSFHLYQEDTTSYARYVIENLVVYKKMSASLLVDGSIEARHIKAGSIEAGHIKAGSVTASVLSADAVTASKLKVDSALIDKLTANDLLARRITTSTLFATSVQAVEISAAKVKSGILASRNGAMTINLDSAEIDYYQNAQIRFHSANNALVRRKDTHTAFVHFNDVSSDSDGGVGSLYASIGVTSSGDGINSASSGRFCGARFFRGARGHQHGATIDQAEIYGDDVIIKDDFQLSRGFKFRPTHIDKMIDMNYLVGAVRSLARCWLHLRNVGWNPQHQNFINAVNDEYNNHQRSL